MPTAPNVPLDATASPSASAELGAAASPAALRQFGRFELRALLSKTERSMLWLVFDSRSKQEMLLAIPREAPDGAQALAAWIAAASNAARVQHPRLAHVVEVANVEHWPYVAYDRALGETLEERLARQGAPLPMEMAGWIAQGLEGLAFAHEAGHAHRDIQASSLLIDAAGHVRLLGIEVVQHAAASSEDGIVARRAVRESAEEDVLRMGLLLHRGLTGRQVLDQQDLSEAVRRMPPQGAEIVRLGWENPHQIADPLRAICNRATDRQPKQRYHSARSFLRALEGWISAASDQGGIVAQLVDRIQRYGHLPSLSTRLQHVAQSSSMDSQHVSVLSELVMKDMALSLELLRRVNLALRQEGLETGGGAVLNVQRAIAMLGLNGVQAAARGLKLWPGLMNEQQAAGMQLLMKRVHRAGQIAQALRPAGYDADVVYVISVMQNLGRLLLQYHFPDDAQQIRQLMVPPEPTADAPNPAPMSEQAAAFAVLGCDLESLGVAVARHWGLGDELLHMMRRHSPDAPVRGAHSDAEMLRLTCSLANELLEALLGPERSRKSAVEAATRRYARALGIGLREVQAALAPPESSGPPPAVRAAAAAAAPADAAAAPTAGPAKPAAPVPSRLRAKAGGDTTPGSL